MNQTVAPSDPLVCFVHGLEGSPQGAKITGMRAQGVRVVAPDMHMSAWSLRRKNSAVRSILRLNEVRALGVAALGSALITHRARSPWPLAAFITLGAGWLAHRKQDLSRRGLAASFDTCLAIISQQLEEARPDVVIGSSWGGAICMELVRRGAISSPTILLAPAYRKVGEHLGWEDLPRREAQIRAQMAKMEVEIFHDPADDVIPFAHSQDFVEGTSIRLYGLEAGGHTLLGLIEDGSLVRSIHDLHRKRTLSPLRG